jgi:hypothetical protein
MAPTCEKNVQIKLTPKNFLIEKGKNDKQWSNKNYTEN